MTRGERNNNPANLRLVPGTTWEGESPTQTDSAFVQFIDPVYGIRALVRVLRSYEREGISTVAEAIDRFAPPNENNSNAYVMDVCARCDVEPTQILSLDSIMPQLVSAIIHHENGECIYTGDQITQGIALA